MRTQHLIAVSFLALFVSSATVGCSSLGATPAGSVVSTVSPTDANVSLGKGEVKVGDKIHLFENRCQPGPEQAPVCERILVAQGQVIQVVGDHYSIVRFQQGTALREGMTVEKAD